MPGERSSLFDGVTCRTRALGTGAGVDAGTSRSGVSGAVCMTVDAFVFINVLPRCRLSFTVALAESLCLEVPSHEEVEEVSSVPASRLFWLVAVSDPACGP